MTIRNLAEPIKRKLRLRAASHGRSMEAEVRDILARTLVEELGLPADNADECAARRNRIEAVLGIWKDRSEGKSTDAIMKELRGDD